MNLSQESKRNQDPIFEERVGVYINYLSPKNGQNMTSLDEQTTLEQQRDKGIETVPDLDIKSDE